MDNEVVIAANTMVDLVLVRCLTATRIVLMQAPAWSGLEPEDSVVLSDGNPAIVKSCITICKEDATYGFILCLANATTPPEKIRKKVMYEEFIYIDEEEGATNG